VDANLFKKTEVGGNKMNRNIIFMIILGILVLVSLFQAYQLTALKSKIDAGTVKISSTKSATPATGGGSPTGNSLDSLPSMVGGC
jgi:hypothetical protein